ncbi:MAG: hypothetical protein MMC23_007972 [Stictis urceolatum]|nr:hypothetical protein [Stictis urceolata]
MLSSAISAIEITNPDSGGSISVSGTSLSVQYSGASADTATLIVTLMVGGDTEDTAGVLGAGTLNQPPASGTLKITGVAQGPPDKNAYFFKIQSSSAAGGQSITFSDRFSVKGMNGAFPAAGTTSASEVEAAYKKVSGNIKAVPDDTDAVAPPAAGAAATGNAPAYSLQTDGTTKMAPMQPRPGTSITKKETTPLYPTTAYKLATTALSTPKFKITQTVSNPSKVKSRPNTGKAVAEPTDDMAKFLARWRD